LVAWPPTHREHPRLPEKYNTGPEQRRACCHSSGGCAVAGAARRPRRRRRPWIASAAGSDSLNP
jgi:hypothetical protein